MNIWLHFFILSFLLLYIISHMLYMLSMHDNGFLSKLLYIIVIICAIYIFIKDYSLLPFLGKSAFPSTVIVDEKYPKNYTYQHVLKLPDVEDGRKIIYWAAKQDKDNKKIYDNPWIAYGDYENVGVTKVKNNEAIIKLNLPNSYKIHFDKEIVPHFHYRICCDENIMLSEVKKVYIYDYN